MRNRVYWGVVLAALCLASSPVFAEIVLTLENPGSDSDVSGITTISGWAFAQNGQPLTLKLRLDGITREDFTIPCCSLRQDVADKFPLAPKTTGFGLLFSYGLLSYGPHLIGIEARAQGEQTLTVDRLVTDVKPGARSGEAAFLFSFLDDLNPIGANLALDGREVIIAPVSVVDSGIAGTRKSTLRLLWESGLQSFSIVSAASSASFAGVQSIFSSSCATQQCHSDATAAAGLSLGPANAFKSLVPIRSIQAPSSFRVDPGDALASYLYQKIISGGVIAAGTSRMPPNCSGNTCLTQDQINQIANWINEGAPPPQ